RPLVHGPPNTRAGRRRACVAPQPPRAAAARSLRDSAALRLVRHSRWLPPRPPFGRQPASQLLPAAPSPHRTRFATDPTVELEQHPTLKASASVQARYAHSRGLLGLRPLVRWMCPSQLEPAGSDLRSVAAGIEAQPGFRRPGTGCCPLDRRNTLGRPAIHPWSSRQQAGFFVRHHLL